MRTTLSAINPAIGLSADHPAPSANNQMNGLGGFGQILSQEMSQQTPPAMAVPVSTLTPANPAPTTQQSLGQSDNAPPPTSTDTSQTNASAQANSAQTNANQGNSTDGTQNSTQNSGSTSANATTSTSTSPSATTDNKKKTTSSNQATAQATSQQTGAAITPALTAEMLAQAAGLAGAPASTTANNTNAATTTAASTRFGTTTPATKGTEPTHAGAAATPLATAVTTPASFALPTAIAASSASSATPTATGMPSNPVTSLPTDPATSNRNTGRSPLLATDNSATIASTAALPAELTAPAAASASTIQPTNVLPNALTSAPTLLNAATSAADVSAGNQLSAQIGTPDWNQALSQRVLWMVHGGEQSATLSLNPPDLGPLQVVLNVSNSQANATFITAQPEVKQALEAAMPQLQSMLAGAGIQLGQANVQSGSSGQQQQPSPWSTPGQSGRETSTASLSLPVNTEKLHYGQGLVNTFV